MRMLRRLVAVILATLTAASLPLKADDHVARAADVAARLAQAAEARRQNLATLSDTLASPTMLGVASGLGVDTEKLRSRLGHLSDQELADLAARAAALQTDPDAGRLSGAAITWIIIGGVALLVLIIALAVATSDCYYNTYGNYVC